MATKHIRQQIREAIETLLTGLTTTGANVFKARLDPYQASELPALNIRGGAEDAADGTSAGYPSRKTRSTDVIVEIHVRQLADYDDKIDDILKEIETALFASTTTYSLSGAARGGVRITSVGEPDFDGDGDLPIAKCEVRLTCTYFMNQHDPVTPL